MRDVGQQLFQALFTGPVYGMYRASMAMAQQRGTRLRVVLRLTAPKLAALPWETLFDPETGTYLCRQEPLVRHVPAPYTPDPLPVRPPLRILALAASPRGLERWMQTRRRITSPRRWPGRLLRGWPKWSGSRRRPGMRSRTGCSQGNGTCCISSATATTTPTPARASSP